MQDIKQFSFLNYVLQGLQDNRGKHEPKGLIIS